MELAIVLVIIGIVLGAVLKGQELIETVKVKRIVNDLKGFEAMMWTYFDRKRNFPGDCNQDGLIEFHAPNTATGMTLSNNINPTYDYCASSVTIETDVNRAFSDMRVARIAPYAQPNVLLAKHTNNDYFHIGFSSVGGVNYNAIFIYGIPAWMAKMIDVSFDGVEDGTTGRVRRHDTVDGGSPWPGDVDNNTLVSIEYFYDRTP